MKTAPLVLLAALAAAGPAAGLAQAAAAHPAATSQTGKRAAKRSLRAKAHGRKQPVKPTQCAAVKPSKIAFRRNRGATVGTVTWRVPRNRTTQAKGKTAVHYRVSRGHSIVGQTAKRSLRVHVVLGRSYKFAVTALSPAGKRMPCSVAATVRVAYRAPGAPQYPAVQGDERGLRLTWQPGAPGDGRTTGYRVLRSGKVVQQTSATSMSLSAAPNRSYDFAVVAVDASGHASAPSATVRAVTGHAPPTAPAGLTAMAVSDTAIGVNWQPSTVAVGSVVAYRIMRDGAVVKQVPATSTVIDNLAPSTDYDVSVVAIDDMGYASAPAQASARTQDPVPTSGHAQAYLLASTDQSFADFEAHYQQIGTVYPTYYDCTNNTSIEGRDDPLMTRFAQARKVEVLPRINCQRSAVEHRILTDPTTRATWITHLVDLADKYDYSGLSIDFEAGPATDRAAYTSFIKDLAARMHADGRKLAVALSAKFKDDPTHPRSGIFDYRALSQYADYLIVMAWGIHWATSAPGAQDEIAWVQQVASYVATMPDPGRFIFGTNLYAMDWPNGGGAANTATAYEYQDAMAILSGNNAQIRLDPVSDNYQALYTAADGVSHEVWYPDATTTERRIGIAKTAGFGGVAFWRLGREDQRVWDVPQLAPGSTW
ncbi:MAG TPA: glycosyl hydrolase family 18 protein [Conexibacter sp.]